MHPGTFDTEDPAVLHSLDTMFDDLLPYFSSNQFNVGCDETYELGLGTIRRWPNLKAKVSYIYLSFRRFMSWLRTRQNDAILGRYHYPASRTDPSAAEGYYCYGMGLQCGTSFRVGYPQIP